MITRKLQEIEVKNSVHNEVRKFINKSKSKLIILLYLFIYFKK